MFKTIALLLLLAPLAAADEIELPFELHPRYRGIFINVQIGGRDAWMLVDTGAGSTFVRASLVGIGEAGIARARFRSDIGVEIAHVRLDAWLQLGTWRREVKVGAANLTPLSERYGRTVDGVLGQDVLRHFSRVTIDFEAKKLILTR